MCPWVFLHAKWDWSHSTPTHGYLCQKSYEYRGDWSKHLTTLRIEVQQEGQIFRDSIADIHGVEVTGPSSTPCSPTPDATLSTGIIKACPIHTELFNFCIRLHFLNRKLLMIFVLFSDGTGHICLNIRIFFSIWMAVGEETSVLHPCHDVKWCQGLMSGSGCTAPDCCYVFTANSYRFPRQAS